MKLKLEISQIKDKMSKFSEEEKVSSKNFIQGPLERLKTEEKFAYEGLLNLIKHDPEQVRFTMIDSVLQSVGDFGTERVSFLKDWFRKILENVIPIDSKAAIVLFDNISLSKFIKKHKEK